MKAIWKYPLDLNVFSRARQWEFDVPKGATPLCLQMQHGTPTLWMMVDAKAPTENRRFTMYGTGHEMPEDPGQYIGTFQLDGGLFVFHVFEVG
jgi:hypothetical protein